MQRILTVVAALLLLVSGAALTQSEGWLTRFSVEPEAEQQEALTPWQFGQEHCSWSWWISRMQRRVRQALVWDKQQP